MAPHSDMGCVWDREDPREGDPARPCIPRAAMWLPGFRASKQGRMRGPWFTPRTHVAEDAVPATYFHRSSPSVSPAPGALPP